MWSICYSLLCNSTHLHFHISTTCSIIKRGRRAAGTSIGTTYCFLPVLLQQPPVLFTNISEIHKSNHILFTNISEIQKRVSHKTQFQALHITLWSGRRSVWNLEFRGGFKEEKSFCRKNNQVLKNNKVLRLPGCRLDTGLGFHWCRN